jgi:hypothetical protein
MRQQIVEGQPITLRSSLGIIQRIAVQVVGDVVLICRQDEFEAAKRERRAPFSIGFRLDDVVDSTDQK